MIRVKKVGADGLEHEYWEMTEEEKVKAKAEAEERKAKLQSDEPKA